jgi:hypothetical protein
VRFVLQTHHYIPIPSVAKHPDSIFYHPPHTLHNVVNTMGRLLVYINILASAGKSSAFCGYFLLVN